MKRTIFSAICTKSWHALLCKRLHMLPHCHADADMSFSIDARTSLQRQQYSIAHQKRAWVCVIVADSFTYLCPSLPVEHRPSTTPRHRTLFWAALVIPDQLVPCCFSSASVSHLQLLRGRPLFLFPCGFQVRAWRVVLDAGFLRVCPIQPHFLRSICLALVPVPLAPTVLHFGSSLAIGFCRCASDRC